MCQVPQGTLGQCCVMVRSTDLELSLTQLRDLGKRPSPLSFVCMTGK